MKLKGIFMALAIIGSMEAFAANKSICGQDDDRKLSNNEKVARLSKSTTSPGGCTATMISSTCAISAGHCKSAFKFAEFNTPKSVAGQPQPSKPEDVYAIDEASIKSVNGGPGNDWAVFKVNANSVTGKYAGDAQGHYSVSFDSVQSGDIIRITGYGVDRGDAIRHLAQQTHTGEVKAGNTATLQHIADTMGGNSGSSIILESTQEIIGIHTHGGCSSWGGTNKGTAIAHHEELKKAIKACLKAEKRLR